jgi:hypothetical protein
MFGCANGNDFVSGPIGEKLVKQCSSWLGRYGLGEHGGDKGIKGLYCLAN